jgi:hypothetical protein
VSTKHEEVLAIVTKHLDAETLEIVRSALAADDRMQVIRDAFLEGRDHEAVHLIRQLDPTVKLWYLLPCSSGVPILPTQSAQITARPQSGPFAPRYLLVSRNCGAQFQINDIRVSNRSEFLQTGDVPADVFMVDAPSLEALFNEEKGWFTVTIDRAGSALLGVRLDIAEVQASHDLQLIITNISDQTLPFSAAWLGEVKHR